MRQNVNEAKSVLVVEDDPMIRQLIEMYLKKNSYHVHLAVDGAQAKEQFIEHAPCLIILDLMLPKLSGEDFCQWVRQDQKSEAAIIMLTAKVRQPDQITGLKLGADDYMAKPFSPDELMARVEAVLRRTGHHCLKVTHNGLTIRPRKGEVWLNGVSILLTKYEFNMLYYLMQHPNTIVSREQLLDQIHPLDEKEILERTIDVHIKKLRDKIENNPSEPKRIQTVRGMGYKFVVQHS